MSIPSPSQLPQEREAALRWYRQLLLRAAEKSDEHVLRGKRWLSQHDLFYLLVFTCKRKDVNRDWLFDRCREVQAEPYDHADLWSRFHFKSSIKTFGLNIMEILNDPEITIAIFSDSNKVAKPFLRQIKQEFENNDDLKAQFPDILWEYPAKQAPKWSEADGIVVKRKDNPKEPTVAAYGVIDGQPTGSHFKKLDYDDLVTQDSVGTPEQIQKVKDRFRMSFNLGVGPATKRSLSGTRYHMFDAYRMAMDEGIFKPRIYPVTHDGTEHGEPVLMTREEVAKYRKDLGIYVFGSQMLMNPTADTAQGFREEWLRYWPCVNFSNLNKYIIVDPAGSKQRKKNDWTTFWVIGYGADKKFRVCDVVRDRLNLKGRTDTLFALHRKWEPLGVGYEEYGMQADIEHIEGEQERLNYEFKITPLGGQIPKNGRIGGLVPTFEAGNLLLPQRGILYTNYEGMTLDLIRVFIDDEYTPYPVLKHDDMLDGLARIHDPAMDIQAPIVDLVPTERGWRDEFEATQGGGPDWMTA